MYFPTDNFSALTRTSTLPSGGKSSISNLWNSCHLKRQSGGSWNTAVGGSVTSALHTHIWQYSMGVNKSIARVPFVIKSCAGNGVSWTIAIWRQVGEEGTRKVCWGLYIWECSLHMLKVCYCQGCQRVPLWMMITCCIFEDLDIATATGQFKVETTSQQYIIVHLII